MADSSYSKISPSSLRETYIVPPVPFRGGGDCGAGSSPAQSALCTAGCSCCLHNSPRCRNPSQGNSNTHTIGMLLELTSHIPQGSKLVLLFYCRREFRLLSRLYDGLNWYTTGLVSRKKGAAHSDYRQLWQRLYSGILQWDLYFIFVN